MQGDDERHRRIDHLFSVDRLNFTNLRGGLIKGWWRNAESGEKERKKEPGIRGRKGRGEGGKKEFTNYKMQLSAFVRGVSRSIEAVPAFEWVAKLLYRVCNL